MHRPELSSSFVGTRIRDCSVKLTARQTMNFAAGILDESECYFDDLRVGGIVAHPMQICSLTWQMSSRFSEFLMTDGFPQELSQHQVHYTETVVWHRPMLPGDELTIEGHIAAILPHRRGTHLIVQYDAHDTDNQPVFTEYTGALLRGVQCSDAGRGHDIPLPEAHNPEAPSNQTTPAVIWEAALLLHPLAAHLYDGCANISFPIHSSPSFAKSVGLPGIIMQGTATAAMALSQLIQRESNGDPRLVSRIGCCFTGMIFPGSTIFIRLHHRVETTDGQCLLWSVSDEQGRQAITSGSLIVKRGR